jgi:hypothetical protein
MGIRSWAKRMLSQEAGTGVTIPFNFSYSRPAWKLSEHSIQKQVGKAVDSAVMAEYGPDLECLPANQFSSEIRDGFRRILAESIQSAHEGEDPYELASEVFTKGVAAGFQGFGMVFALSDKQKSLVEVATTDYYVALQDSGVKLMLEQVVLPILVIPVSGGSIVVRGG